MSTKPRTHSPISPIFIHSLPRVGSTWLGYKFDDQPDFLYKFEPFHENLIAGTQASLQRAFEQLRWGESLRHPSRAQHYHKDYRFQPDGGVALFQKRFCYENYYMEPGQTDDPLKAYLASQLAEACEHDKRICVKSAQSALRASWLAHTFPGIHMYVFRSPRLIDNSHFSFRGYSNRYIRDYGLIIGQNGWHPVFSELSAWCGLDSFVSDSLEDEYAHYRKIFYRDREEKYDRQYHFDCLCFFWSMALGLATRYAELIIDMDTLAYDDMRCDTETIIRDLTGFPIDLSDYFVDERRSRRILHRHRMTVSNSMAAIIQNALSYIEPDWDRALAFALSTQTEEAIRFFDSRSSNRINNRHRRRTIGSPSSHASELFRR